MDAFFADDISKILILCYRCSLSTQILMEFVSNAPINNNPVSVHIMFWLRTGHKPLPESTMALFTDAYLHQSLLMGSVN